MKSITPITAQSPTFSIVLISNGPGELATWVRPIAEKLHQKLLIRPRVEESNLSLKLVLVPCPNSTGKEKEAANRWQQFDQIIEAKNFWQLVINPKRFCNWSKKGLVVFLGGDQFWSVLLASRLRYKNMTYAEWISRWPQWNDRICAMSEKVMNKVPKKYLRRCKVVGDLMADLHIPADNKYLLPEGKWVALLPGSKKAKLSIGVPFMLEVADHLKNRIPECKFLLPIAPTTSIQEIQKLSGPLNPISNFYQSKIKSIVTTNDNTPQKKFITDKGTEIYLEENNPAHISLSQCQIAITTIGANTSELGALCLPMIVVVPTQHLNAMQAWDGLLGLIARLPLLKYIFSFVVSKWRLRKKNLLAWPNISAGRIVVPEKVGKILPAEIAFETAQWLKSPDRLKGQKEDLKNLRGKSGAVELMAKEIIKLIENI